MEGPVRAGDGSCAPGDALKLRALRMHIKAGIDALDRGEFVEVADVDLDAYLERLMVGSDGPVR